MVLLGRFVYGGVMLSAELSEAMGGPVEESFPSAVKELVSRLTGRWKVLWTRARNEGIESLRTRDKYLLLQALEMAAEEAGYKTPELQARVVDQAMAFTTRY